MVPTNRTVLMPHERVSCTASALDALQSIQIRFHFCARLMFMMSAFAALGRKLVRLIRSVRGSLTLGNVASQPASASATSSISNARPAAGCRAQNGVAWLRGGSRGSVYVSHSCARRRRCRRCRCSPWWCQLRKGWGVLRPLRAASPLRSTQKDTQSERERDGGTEQWVMRSSCAPHALVCTSYVCFIIRIMHTGCSRHHARNYTTSMSLRMCVRMCVCG